MADAIARYTAPIVDVVTFTSGTLEERGITKWKEQLVDADATGEAKMARCYEIPFISEYIRKYKWTSYVPLCPTYTPGRCKCPSRSRRKSNASRCDSVDTPV